MRSSLILAVERHVGGEPLPGLLDPAAHALRIGRRRSGPAARRHCCGSQENMIGSIGSRIERKRRIADDADDPGRHEPPFSGSTKATPTVLPTASAGLRKPIRRAASSLITILAPRATSAALARHRSAYREAPSWSAGPVLVEQPAGDQLDPHRLEEFGIDAVGADRRPARSGPAPGRRYCCCWRWRRRCRSGRPTSTPGTRRISSAIASDRSSNCRRPRFSIWIRPSRR